MRSEAEPVCEQVTHEDLLLHYVGSTQGTVQSVDQLGNFLMGFGVLALGYLLHQDLAPVVAVVAQEGGEAAADRRALAQLALGAWGLAVCLLVAFVWVYVSQVLPGRSVHAGEGSGPEAGGSAGEGEGPGAILALPKDVSFRDFMRSQRTFPEFLQTHYAPIDRRTPEALLYARFSYVRFMVVKKLAAMARMRRLLGPAILAGVAFKVLTIALG